MNQYSEIPEFLASSQDLDNSAKSLAKSLPAANFSS